MNLREKTRTDERHPNILVYYAFDTEETNQLKVIGLSFSSLEGLKKWANAAGNNDLWNDHTDY